LINVQVSTILGTAPVLIAYKYFWTTIAYYLPVILFLDEVNWNYLRVDFILFRSSILWLTNYGRRSYIGIWSRFWSLFSSIKGLTKVKQSLWVKADVIVFLIDIFCCYLLFILNAISRYWWGVIIFPFSSTSCKVKSRTTQINWGRHEIFYWSILLTRLRTKLNVWRAFSSILPTLL
jgi:hypothetical protein